MRRYRDSLSRERLFDIIVATCPVSYWINSGGQSQIDFRKRLALRYPR